MSEWMGLCADDYSDLGFDVERHKEAFRAFANLEMDVRSVRAALTAREAVVVQYPSAKFRVGSTSDLIQQQTEEQEHGCVGFAGLYQADDPEEVDQVRAQVWGYFLRHFPGRCLSLAEETLPSEHAHHVFITLFIPATSVALPDL